MLIRRRLHPVAVLCGLALLSGCTLPGQESGGSGSTGRVVSPFLNPDGTKPGLAPVTAKDERARARTLIEGLATRKRGPRTGYARDEFGEAWLDKADGVPLARNGCDTRNDLLRRDGRELRFRDGSNCVVVSMTLDDPYTGTVIDWRKQKASEVQIDHVVPLSYAWQMGASRWTDAKRQRLANDPLNLLPVQGRANSSKGDSGPASWLPPAKGVRCAYAVRFAQVAEKYALPVTAPDRKAMLEQCGG
ncbi:HNH endonuclease family protein [Streptomyces omiyaensis]|uniref:HNH endonuclease family protein n=1 Tax=Streptomyces omiyaensis TaxID=68247 RepID=A0ABW7BY88_9ACTN|nr:lipoprotein [Streptomyces omiyaensis]